MMHHLKGLDLEITVFKYYHDLTDTVELCHLKPQGMLYVDIILLCETLVEHPTREASKWRSQ